MKTRNDLDEPEMIHVDLGSFFDSKKRVSNVTYVVNKMLTFLNVLTVILLIFIENIILKFCYSQNYFSNK